MQKEFKSRTERNIQKKKGSVDSCSKLDGLCRDARKYHVCFVYTVHKAHRFSIDLCVNDHILSECIDLLQWTLRMADQHAVHLVLSRDSLPV